jgi:hypothetical protein
MTARRLCYRPAVFFRHVILIALLFQQGKIRIASNILFNFPLLFKLLKILQFPNLVMCMSGTFCVCFLFNKSAYSLLLVFSLTYLPFSVLFFSINLHPVELTHSQNQTEELRIRHPKETKYGQGNYIKISLLILLHWQHPRLCSTYDKVVCFKTPCKPNIICQNIVDT